MINGTNPPFVIHDEFDTHELSEDEKEPTYDLNQEEDLLVQLDDGEVVHLAVISDTNGWCSCELDHDGPLDYHIGLAGLEFPDPFGTYVIEGCTGTYYKGDGWTTDDDADFYPGTIRPATPEEQKQV